ncbi:MAG: hypothetical protein GWP19_03170 [Planctomycetia bacterium]|nr:hypothetical protein [Planctomycetia bacterium]
MIRKFSIIIIIASIILFNSCDIIDEIMGAGKDNSNLTPQQEQALTTVTTIQDNASDIMDNLFTSGMDTLDVIDSLANFFLADTSIQNVWPDSEGVAVEYKSGISGGIFIGRFLPDTVSGAPPDTFIIDNSYRNLARQVTENVVYSPQLKKSIYFDGAYDQFKNYNDKIITAANNGFSKVGIEPFVKYLNKDANIDVLSTLDEYGIIYLTGHGWYYTKSQFGKLHETYLLTGEKAVINKTYGNLWDDILLKNIIIVKYDKENRYWVSPKFVADRNDFHNNKVFIYDGICNSLRGTWSDELVYNAGASVLVGYDWPIYPKFESSWVAKMFDQMCDTSQTNPKTISNCIDDIIHDKSFGIRGWYTHGIQNHKLKYIYLKYRGDKDYTFWEDSLRGIGVEVYLDNVTYKSCTNNDSCWNTDDLWESNYFQSGIFVGDGGGSWSLNDNIFMGTLDDILGDTEVESGTMKITFIDDPKSVNIDIVSNIIDTTFTEQKHVEFRIDGLPYDNGLYQEFGSTISRTNYIYTSIRPDISQEIVSFSCDADAYVKVHIYKNN